MMRQELRGRQIAERLMRADVVIDVFPVTLRGAERGQIEVPGVGTATHLLAGALLDGAMMIGSAPGDAAVWIRVEETILRLLRGLAPPSRSRRLAGTQPRPRR